MGYDLSITLPQSRVIARKTNAYLEGQAQLLERIPRWRTTSCICDCALVRTSANKCERQEGEDVTGKQRLTVLLDAELAKDFEAFCEENSHKKSTFVAHLLKEFLKKEGYPDQARLL